MKKFLLAAMLLTTSTSFAGTSIDKCVEDALKGARESLAKSENILPQRLFIEEAGMLINDDEQYLKTRKELETLCRRLYIGTIELGE